jgi:hypothetical protein
VVILLDPDSSDEGNGRFHNLVALDRSGQPMWIAELPTLNPGDRYYQIPPNDPLIAYSVSSYDCVIDRRTGRISSKTFTK